MNRILLQNNSEMFTIFEDGRGRTLMTVAVGGVAMSEVTIQPTEDEAHDLATDEGKAITLSRQVSTRTSIFEERRIRPAVSP